MIRSTKVYFFAGKVQLHIKPLRDALRFQNVRVTDIAKRTIQHKIETDMQISVMLAVENAPKATAWYKEALGAHELWNLGSAIGLSIAGAPFFVGEPANNGRASPTQLDLPSVRVQVFCEDPDAFIEREVAAGVKGAVQV